MPTIIREIPGLGFSNGRPVPNPRPDLAGQHLSPTEAFVMSRVDGQTSYADLCLLTGLGEEQTLEILRRLQAAGLILPAAPAARAEKGRPQHDVVVTESRHANLPRAVKGGSRQSARPKSIELLEQLDDGSPVSAADIEGAPELDEITRKRLVRLHRRLAQLDDYTILGLQIGATKQDVQRAYFAASKEFHPDRYFGKAEGKFRQMLADIFGRASQAFERLRDRA